MLPATFPTKSTNQISTDASSDKGVSPKVSPTMSPRLQQSPGAKSDKPDRSQTAGDFRMAFEEKKTQQDSKSAVRRSESMITEKEMKLDDKINFQSFDILKQLGSGAFGKVYKARILC